LEIVLASYPRFLPEISLTVALLLVVLVDASGFSTRNGLIRLLTALGLATALANLGQLEESRAALMGALGVDPRSGQAHFNLGELARLAGRSDEARHHYEAALDDEATRTAARARLAP